VLDQGGEESSSFRLVLAQGEGLLELVHDEKRGRTLVWDGGERIHRTGSRGDHHGPMAVTAIRRGNAGSHERRLAAAGRPHDGQNADGGQPLQARREVGVAAEVGI
jgi:hypothetical protein